MGKYIFQVKLSLLGQNANQQRKNVSRFWSRFQKAVLLAFDHLFNKSNTQKLKILFWRHAIKKLRNQESTMIVVSQALLSTASLNKWNLRSILSEWNKLWNNPHSFIVWKEWHWHCKGYISNVDRLAFTKEKGFILRFCPFYCIMDLWKNTCDRHLNDFFFRWKKNLMTGHHCKLRRST